MNDEELGEYYGHQFATIKVDLKEYEKISAAVMKKYNSNGTVGSTDLMSGVKYFDKDGKEVTMDADKGTKVAYAEISYSGVVTGDITYTTANQAAYADAKLVAKDSYFFTNQDQSAKVENDAPDVYKRQPPLPLLRGCCQNPTAFKLLQKQLKICRIWKNQRKIVRFVGYRIPLAARKKPAAQGLADAAGRCV